MNTTYNSEQKWRAKFLNVHGFYQTLSINNLPIYLWCQFTMAELAARSLCNLRFRLIAEAWVRIPAGSKSDLTYVWRDSTEVKWALRDYKRSRVRIPPRTWDCKPWPFSNLTCCSVSQVIWWIKSIPKNGRTTKDQVYTVIDYADDGGRTWMNAKKCLSRSTKIML